MTPPDPLRPDLDGLSGAAGAADRDELLAFLLADEGIGLAGEGIAPRDRSQPAVLSYAQERMWFLDQLDGEESSLEIHGSVALHGALDVDALERSLTEIVRRHQVLRTVIVVADGEPRPHVLPPEAVPLRHVDVDGDESKLSQILAAEAKRRFDLKQDAPISIALIRVSDDHYVLSILMHHVASDGSSFDVFSRELGTLYAAFADGKQSPLPDLAVQYEDYAAWQRHGASAVFSRQLDYWRQQLAGPLPTFEIPTDFARPARHTFDGAVISTRLPDDVVAGLEELCRRSGATMFMTLLAAFDVVTSRHSGETDVLIGTPIAGRVRLELEPMIGAFLNTLVMRNDLADRPTFRALLNRVRTTCVDAYAHQDVPFELLLADLQPVRDLSRTPLFQIFFNMTHLDPVLGSNAPSGLRTEQLESPGVAANFDLTMYVNETVDGFDARLVYNSGLYNAAHMEELVQQYQHLLAQIADDPDRCIDDYSLVDDRRSPMLPDASMPLDSTWHGSVPDAIRAAAAQEPDRVSVVDGSSSWTSGIVAAQMERLATWLHQRDVGRGDVVGIHGHRTGSLVWTVAGVLASGASYVLLDSRYPAPRLSQLVRIARPTAWLALEAAGPTPTDVEAALDAVGADHRLTLPEITEVAELEALLEVSAADVAASSTVDIGADDAACLTFTSGSTGRPKAVVGRHGSLTHFLSWMSDEFGIGPEDRFSMLSGLSHDPLQRDMFWPLSLGATIVVPDPDLMGSPGYLAEWLRDQRVTVAHLTPAMGQLVTEHVRGGREASPLDALRIALFIGDVLTRGQAAELRALAPAVSVVNLYGTTETQRASGFHVVDLDGPAPQGRRVKEVLPLGRGMPGAQLLVRTPSGAPAGIGEVGEIVMRSPHLALGYYDDAELTESRFEPDPHAPASGGQLYATGDRGRYRADGSVEFLGRNDDQVQLRGFRIELGEVAAALRAESAVSDAVVVLRSDQSAPSRLVAYAVAGDGEPLDVTALTRSLRSALPAHMVPSDIVTVERIPLTPNGKLDRHALPAPRRDGERLADVEFPRDQLEQTLVDVWEHVLGRDGIGVHHDFFSLGGYSLLATRVLALVEDELATQVPVSALFENPTVAELAATIREGAWRASDLAPLVPVDRSDASLPAVLSFAQERMWFLEQFETDRAALSIRTALALHGPLDLAALRAGLDEIYCRHDVLRTVIASDSGDPKPSTLPPSQMPFAYHDVDGNLQEADRIRAVEAARTFDLETEPPIFVSLVRITDDHHVLSVVMHHVASDASSFGVFFGELRVRYQAHLDGTSPPVEELAIQYEDYAAWQRSHAGDLFQSQLAYWRDQLAGPLPQFEIPPDFHRPERHNVAGARLVGHVSPELVTRLGELAATTGATLFMTLLAGFEIVLSRHADETDVVIGTPVAGRARPELQPMIGVFLNTIVLRTDLGDHPTVREAIKRVRDASLEAFDHQDVPFELLLNELRPPRDVSRTPLFQVFFNMTHHDVSKTFALPGLRTEILDQPEQGSKFDLTMYVNHGADGTDLALVYNRTLFDQKRMERLLDQYLHVLSEMVAQPDRHIDELSLVTAGDRATIPDVSAPLDDAWQGSVPEAICRNADRAPDRVAVVDVEHRWSYAQLATQMSQLAVWLLRHQVGRGDVVAIHAHRSGSLVPAVAGVLASGAAYVLLDPRYPAARLATQLRIARPAAWLELEAAGSPPAEVLAALEELGVDHRLVVPTSSDVDEFATALGHPDAIDDPLVDAAIEAIGPDDPASLTFTSGSTGVPKAVLGRHGSLTYFFPWMSEQFEVDENDRFSMLSGLAHDPLQRDMFWPLWLGARIVVPDPEQIGTAGWLASWMRDEAVTVAHLTPAMGQLLTEPGAARVDRAISLPSLRRALFIGDVLTRRAVADLRRLAPCVRIVNLYGTTETQRASGFYVVDDHPVDALPAGARPKEVLPLGVGMPGTQLLVRTSSGDLAAVGEVGEIAIRSPHLALGYWDDDELTAQRFESDPTGDASAGQLYSTGDRGRYRTDGSIEFLGRADEQVELRGFRIELGEVAVALREHPDVLDAVVQLRADDPRHPRLVGYVRAASEQQLDSAELFRALRGVLPAHMVPSDIVQIDRIPITPNGKLDRRALPAPSDLSASTTGDDAPTDSLERMLVDVWQKVLGRGQVGIRDDFFALGGYSLLATRLFALVEERTGEHLPVSVLFEHPTIAELATAMRDDGWRPDWSSLVPIQPAGDQQPFFYVTPYLISVLELAPLADELGEDQPLYGLQPLGLDGSVRPHRTVEEMAAHYIAELKVVQPDGPYALGGHCSGSWVAFEMARQLEASGEEISALVLVDQGPPGVERTPVKTLPYLAGRVRFYFSSGRLRHALAWSLKIFWARYLLRRARPLTAGRVEEVREAHRVAHRTYEGGHVKQDLTLVLSADSLTLSDKAWYTLWSELTNGRITIHNVGGTHANLLVKPYVSSLAGTIATVLDIAE